MWSPIYKPDELGKAWPDPACPSYFRAPNIVGQAWDNWAWWQTFLVVTTWDATGLQRAEVKDAIVQHATGHWAAPPSLCPSSISKTSSMWKVRGPEVDGAWILCPPRASAFLFAGWKTQQL